MPRGRRSHVHVTMPPGGRTLLEAALTSSLISAAVRRRCRIILLRAEGYPITAIAQVVGLQRPYVYKWLRRFQAQGLAGLARKPGSGRPPGRKNWCNWFDGHLPWPEAHRGAEGP